MPGCRKFFLLIGLLGIALGVFLADSVLADVIINVLAVNGSDRSVDKNIEFSLPGEITPDDVIDSAGLEIAYNVKDSGYFLHGQVSLSAKESRTLKVRVRDVWEISSAKLDEIRAEIETSYKEMGAEKDQQNGDLLKQSLLSKIDYIVQDQSESTGSIDSRIDIYRNHIQSLNEIRDKAKSIDFWRSNAHDPAQEKSVFFKVSISNPTERTKKIKQQHFLPKEVRPEYIIDRKGYEIRFDEKKAQPFLFKEEDIAAKDTKTISFEIRDVWYVPDNLKQYVRDRAKSIYDLMLRSPFKQTAEDLYKEIINLTDLIDSLQATPQKDIEQHIGAYRLNLERFQRSRQLLDDLEKLLSRHRAELEKSKIKNVMQKMQSMKSLARVSQAIFDKKPTVNAAWKIIGVVMLFLAIFMLAYTVFLFLRSSREKKQELLKQDENAASAVKHS